MEKKGITDKVFNNIDFNTYKKISLFASVGTLGSNLAHWISILTGGG